jgi:hypothetical protein
MNTIKYLIQLILGNRKTVELSPAPSQHVIELMNRLEREWEENSHV